MGWLETSGRLGIQAGGSGLTLESAKPGGRVCTEATCVHPLLRCYFQAAFPDSPQLGYVLLPGALKTHSAYVMVALNTFKEIICVSVSSLEVKPLKAEVVFLITVSPAPPTG